MWIEWKKYKRNNDAEDDGNDLHNQDKGNCLIPYLTLFFMPNWFFFTIIHSVFFFIKLPSPFRMTIHRIVRSIVMIRWYVCTATRIAFFHIWLLVFFSLSLAFPFASICFILFCIRDFFSLHTMSYPFNHFSYLNDCERIFPWCRWLIKPTKALFLSFLTSFFVLCTYSKIKVSINSRFYEDIWINSMC